MKSFCLLLDVIISVLLVALCQGLSADPESVENATHTSVSPFEMHSCIAHPDGVYPDPSNCRRYYHCIGQKTFYFHCFDGFVFDPCHKRCVFQSSCMQNVRCEGIVGKQNESTVENTASSNASSRSVSHLTVAETEVNGSTPRRERDQGAQGVGGEQGIGGAQGIGENKTDQTGNTIRRDDHNVGGEKSGTIRPVSTAGVEGESIGEVADGEPENDNGIRTTVREDQDMGNGHSRPSSGLRDGEIVITTTGTVSTSQNAESEEGGSPQMTSHLITSEAGSIQQTSQLTITEPGVQEAISTGVNEPVGNAVTTTAHDGHTYIVRVIFNRRHSGPGRGTAEDVERTTSHSLEGSEVTQQLFLTTTSSRSQENTIGQSNAPDQSSVSESIQNVHFTTSTHVPEKTGPQITETSPDFPVIAVVTEAAPTSTVTGPSTGAKNGSSPISVEEQPIGNETVDLMNFARNSGGSIGAGRGTSLHQEQKMILQTTYEEVTQQMDLQLASAKTVPEKTTENAGAVEASARGVPLTTPFVHVESPCQCAQDQTGPMITSEVLNMSRKIARGQHLQDYCSSLTCSNGGMYVELSTGDCGCICPHGWNGDQCQFIIDQSQCKCVNGGECVSVGNATFACMCESGYFGSQCQYSVSDELHGALNV